MTLTDYVGSVYRLEIESYKQVLLINRLQAELKRTLNPEYRPPQSLPRFHISDIFTAVLYFAGCTLAGGFAGIAAAFIPPIAAGILFLLTVFFGVSTMEAVEKIYETKVSFFPFMICGAVVGGILDISTIISKISKRKKIKKENRQIAKKNCQVAEYSKICAANLHAELNRAIPLYNQTLSILEQLYNQGIIYTKYRSLVPVSMLYEYLTSGRCSCLEGATGAYNLYEQEIRMNLIVSKLDDIINRLDQIQEHQSMLAHAIQESNHIAQNVYNSIIKCNSQLKEITENTESANYFAQISATNTRYIAWFKNN